MENRKILSYMDLELQILLLKMDKTRQEEKLKLNVKEFINALSPASIVKNSLHELAGDKEVQVDLLKVSLNTGANFLIDKVLGKNKSIKGFLSSLLVEKVSSSLINNNASKIVSKIGQLLNRNCD